MPPYPCLYCLYIAATLDELMEHEEEAHAEMIDALEGIDGNEEEEDITGEEIEED